MGFTRLAADFHRAAAAFDHKALVPSLVAYFLYGHALELSLKALWILEGATDADLRGAGHDLGRSLARVRKVLPRPLTPEEDAVISMLDPYYRQKHFEYVETGFKSLPPLSDVSALSEWMVTCFPKVVRERLKVSP